MTLVIGGDNNNSIEVVTPGERNPFKKTQFRITTGGSNQTTTVLNFSKKYINKYLLFMRVLIIN